MLWSTLPDPDLPACPMPRPRLLQVSAATDDPAAEAEEGLRASQAQLPPKFFYDALGSRLFDAITELSEYYPTRTEAAILARDGARIAEAILRRSGVQPVLVDLGAGNCAKGAALFQLLGPRRYVAVDISADYVSLALEQLQREHPGMDLVGVGMDFSRRFALPAGLAEEGAVVFYPGSSIGNFDPAGALALLGQVRETAGCRALLIGVDLVKDEQTLVAAYDDALGVTAAFNLNVLRHLNRLLGADFDVRQWRHVARFDRALSRIEMHLEAREPLLVRWSGGQRAFVAGERIHTENSYKWTVASFASLLCEAGFSSPSAWTDERGNFGVFVASA